MFLFTSPVNQVCGQRQGAPPQVDGVRSGIRQQLPVSRSRRQSGWFQ